MTDLTREQLEALLDGSINDHLDYDHDTGEVYLLHQGVIAESVQPCDGPLLAAAPRLARQLLATMIERDEAQAAQAVLRDFIEEFSGAMIEALRYSPPYGSSPEDEPDPVVDAETVWAWQTDAKDAIRALPSATQAGGWMPPEDRRVKPLVFSEFMEGGCIGRPHQFQYFITQSHDGRFLCHWDETWHETLLAAQEHAQIDYQSAAFAPLPPAPEGAD